MMDETLRVLEFDKIIALLASFTATGPGRERALALRPELSPEQVAVSLAQIDEAVILHAEQGVAPVGGSRDLRPSLVRLRAEGTWLPPAELLDVFCSIEAARDCRRYFGGRERAPLLGEQARALFDLKALGQEIRQSIGDRGEILDSASFELGDIRHQLMQLRGRIRRILEQMLLSDSLSGAFQDRLITERGGRYVLPVRADHRGQVRGFIHDESASGQTLYVEPTAVLELNNELQSLQRLEKREEERILRRLSAAVRSAAAELAANQQVLAGLDFIAAAARFSRLSKGVAPLLSDEPRVELRGARHPLLLFNPDGSARQGEAVPVDLLLGKGSEVLVISGPNTGGKTVALKTLGLLLLMVQAGLHIPCAECSKVYLFGRVFADIGDEQSIEANLSTFSGHLVRIGRILAGADERSLVLLDEAGTGTDPAEGGALALAVLDELRERGSRVVVTTHLNLVKSYAHMQQGVENAAVEFDSRTLAPTYRLHYGIPGASSAFTIARRLGIPEGVLERAGSYLGDGEREGLNLIEKLNALRKEAEQDRQEASALLESARQERRKRRALLEEIEERKRTILEKATRRGDQLVRESESRLKALLRQASESAAAPAERARMVTEVRQVRETLAEARPDPKAVGKTPVAVEPGEVLRITSLGVDGEVVRVAGSQIEMSVAGKKLRIPLAGLQQYTPRRFGKKITTRAAVRSSVDRDGFSPRLMLVGKRVDVALPLIDRFIDDALLHGINQLEIVHGTGEGILRRAVREFLASHRAVTSFCSADQAQGGENVTLLELGD